MVLLENDIVRICKFEFGALIIEHIKEMMARVTLFVETCLPILFEKVQRAFTKHISGMGILSYSKRLEVPKLYSLQRRRERYGKRLFMCGR